MITKRTVLVLGAGASMEYGFPSGKSLLQHVDQGLHPNSTWGWSDVFDQYGVSADERETFRFELYHSQQPSGDTIL